MAQPGKVYGERGRGNTLPPIVSSEKVKAISGEIGAKRPGISEEEKRKAFEKEEAQNRRFGWSAVATNLDIKKAEFLVSRDGKLPSKLEAKPLIGQLEESLAVSAQAADGVDKDFLDKLSVKGEPYFNTGIEVQIKTADAGEAIFELVVKTATGEYKLHGQRGEDGNETEAGKLAESLMG